MRIIVGSLIKDPVLRMANFKIGLQILRLLKQPNILKSLVDLAYANRSLGVFFVALRFYLIENSVSQHVVNFYKTSIPWPIQKFFLKILHIEVG